ncbi:MAG: nicotinate-nucleotide adenylyltransferase [Pseudoxanthomonas sp.]
MRVGTGTRDPGLGTREAGPAACEPGSEDRGHSRQRQSRFSESRVPGPGSRLHLYYGGTFDPFHNGHLAVARAARDTLACRVVLVPAADPPHRAPPGADAAQRLAMVAAAVAGEPGLAVDRRELERGGPSWTVETLRELRREYGAAAPLAWLVGADSFLSLPSWHDWQDLFGLAHFVVAERPGNALDAPLSAALAPASAGRFTAAPAELVASPAGRIFRLQQPLAPESASAIRQRIAAGQPWRALVPAPVAAFIDLHGLYRAAGL